MKSTKYYITRNDVFLPNKPEIREIRLVKVEENGSGERISYTRGKWNNLEITRLSQVILSEEGEKREEMDPLVYEFLKEELLGTADRLFSYFDDTQTKYNYILSQSRMEGFFGDGVEIVNIGNLKIPYPIRNEVPWIIGDFLVISREALTYLERYRTWIKTKGGRDWLWLKESIDTLIKLIDEKINSNREIENRD